MISACMHQNVMGISPTLVFNPVYSIKAKQKSKSKKGSAGINTGEPKFYSIQTWGAYNDENKTDETKQMNGNKPKLSAR
jgi:hypothetical protein